MQSDGALLSASADGTVQLWQTFTALSQPPAQPFIRDTSVLSASRVFRPGQGVINAVPTSVAFLPAVESTEAAFAVGLTSGDVLIIALDSGRQVHRFEPAISNSGEYALLYT